MDREAIELEPESTSAGLRPSVHEGDAFGSGLCDPETDEQLRRMIPLGVTVLLSGETGTGKTRLARLIHQNSPRCDEPFLVVDCGVLSTTLIESEMFGHVQGAFTGADGDYSGRLATVG